MVDINNINHSPTNELLSSICFSTYESDIKNVIINGNIVYENGEFLNIDEKELVNNIDYTFCDLRNR